MQTGQKYLWIEVSARCWNIAIDQYFKESGYVQSNADPCVYYKTGYEDGKNCLIIAAVYVDDKILASSNKAMLTAEKTKLMERFEMEDLGEINYCLSMCTKETWNAGLQTRFNTD